MNVQKRKQRCSEEYMFWFTAIVKEGHVLRAFVLCVQFFALLITKEQMYMTDIKNYPDRYLEEKG